MSIDSPKITNDVVSKEEEKPQENIPEYDFEAGAKVIIDKVVNLLKEKSKVIIAFNGSSANVGKTSLAKKLMVDLYSLGILATNYHGIEELETSYNTDDSSVFIFEQMLLESVDEISAGELKSFYNNNIIEGFKKIGIDVSGIDIWVGIYKPEAPFYTSSDLLYRPIADVLIRNDLATDKIKK